MIFAGRLEHGQGDVMFGEQLYEEFVPLLIIGHAQLDFDRPQGNIDVGLADIDSRIYRPISALFDLALHSGLAPIHLFR